MVALDIEAIARELMSAHDTGQMVPRPPSSRPGFDLNSAYQVEGVLRGWRESAGHRAVGCKVGYANKAMWRILKLETLVWAHMYDDTVHQSRDNSALLSLAHPHSLKIEPEIVFGMKKPIDSPDPDAVAALQATEWLALGFEIIDCPFPGWQFQPPDFVAWFGLHAALVVGERVMLPSDRIPQLAEELARFKVRMLKNREFVEEGMGRNALRSPALCLAELGKAIQKRSRHELGSGREIVSTGTLTAGHLTESGDQWTAEVEGLAVPPLRLELT
jgi:2-oxo-3-hexenedioate decarboxylase